MKYPLKLKYVPKSAIWGGSTLKNFWEKPCDFDKLAETWELTLRDDAVNQIENGAYAGRTLREFANDHEDCFVGEKFPLLIKFIDAEDRLSVQVHPDDRFAAEVENDKGKTEMWYIADAKEDAEIIYGIRDDVKEVRCDSGIEAQVERVSVRKGDVFFIPAGMLHAIGKGCLIAEIQQNSDLTYRVYDYERRDKNGNLRELHTEKALKVIRPFTEEEIRAIRYAKADTIGVGECLASCEFFCVNKLDLHGEQVSLCADADSFHSVLCVEGEGEILFAGESYPVRKGDSYFLPAGLGAYAMTGNMTVIVSKA